ncbi:unnamed protein product [Musa textilis]
MTIRSCKFMWILECHVDVLLLVYRSDFVVVYSMILFHRLIYFIFSSGCNEYALRLHNLLCSRAFFDKRISQEVSGDALGEEFKGYVFKIMGGCDKQGFPMKQGVLTPGRVRLLLHRGTPCFRGGMA